MATWARKAGWRNSDSEHSVKHIPMRQYYDMVQEADGNFFESFTALSWRQENRRLRASSEEDLVEDKPLPVESQAAVKPDSRKLSKDELDTLYKELMYTIRHRIGTTSDGHSPFDEDLYNYAQEVFHITEDRHRTLLDRAKELKAPKCVLHVTVAEAKDLEAKDANGYSDPYCMLGIVPPSFSPPSTPGGKPKNRLSFKDRQRRKSRGKDKSSTPTGKLSKEEKQEQRVQEMLRKKFVVTQTEDLIAKSPILVSEVRRKTLNPQWNEKFRFEVEDLKNDRLHIDIWDHDDEASIIEAARKLNEVSGIKGVGRYFKQIVQSARAGQDDDVDDFLGCIDINLARIPSTGCDQWFDLEARSIRSKVQGKLRLQLQLGTQERDTPYKDEAIRVHQDLYDLFVEHEARTHSDQVFDKWDGNLSQPAQTILHQHFIQQELTMVDEAIVRWRAYSKQHLQYAFDYEFLYKLLHELHNSWQPDKLTREEEQDLAESFADFIELCMSLLDQHRGLFPPNNKQAICKLEYILRCLQLIDDMPAYSKVCPFHAPMRREIIKVIKQGTKDWYLKVRAITKPMTHVSEEMLQAIVNEIHVLRNAIESCDPLKPLSWFLSSDEEVLQSMVKLTYEINTDVQKALKYYNKLFLSVVKVDYFTVAYKQLESLLHKDINAGMEDINVTLQTEPSPSASDEEDVTISTSLFELYLALKEFHAFKESLPASEKSELHMDSFYVWFEPAIKRWFSLARHKAFRRLEKAVELDKEVELVHSMVKHSTSAVDATCCFGQIREFYRQLDWPDPVGAYTFVTLVMEDICSGARYYAELMHKKLKAAGYFDDEGQFDVTDQLCITLNNIEHVKRSLSSLPESLGFADIERSMQKVYGEVGGQQSHRTLINMMDSADDDMSNKTSDVVIVVGKKMQPDIKKFVFHLAWAPDSARTDDAICPLMEYLDNNLKTLNMSLLRANFDKILDEIWNVVLKELRETLDGNLGKESPFYCRLHEALDILLDLFHADGEGLDEEAIQTDDYKYLRETLTLQKATTDELIEQFFLEKLQEQRVETVANYGTLSVKVYYDNSDSSLHVEVMSGKDLPALDTNGYSDPFVLIELCPSHHFPSSAIEKTSIKKKTLNPLFDETFKFPVAVSQLKQTGACVLFTVMDHDVLARDDVAGEVFLPLAEVYGQDRPSIPEGFRAVKQNTVILIRPELPKCRRPDKHNGTEGALIKFLLLNFRFLWRRKYSPETGPMGVLETRTWDKTAQDFYKKRRALALQCG
ncbi:BAI1-associated protein 3-like isoform X2 [Branchiostoma floridae]|uniref:BAI1-associated protein 3-like isoform X2 n=1 Tax=Branchiostoma floridae TaxID=7739 RepID=A0A9J7M6C7_BRAFL|nr:BAI1-associated protein 3-like isoform X2 [Branchiostoma floridae]